MSTLAIDSTRNTSPPRSWRCRLGLVLAAALCATLVSCGQKPAAESNPTTPASQTPPPTTTAANAAKPEFSRLAGKWVRPDGGYVLEIKSIDAAGKLEAAYLNPNPIQVSQARALKDGDVTKVFIELRDVNYPGCTYSLSYDPKNDQLFGTYFQAAMNQTFDVAFARMGPDQQ